MENGRPVLIALGLLLRWESLRLECRRAVVKRVMRTRGGTHSPYIADVSSDFVLARQRLLKRVIPRHRRAKGRGAKGRGAQLSVRKRGKHTGKRAGGRGTVSSLHEQVAQTEEISE